MEIDINKKLESIKNHAAREKKSPNKEHDLATEIWKYGGKTFEFMPIYMKVKRLTHSSAFMLWRQVVDMDTDRTLKNPIRNPVKLFIYLGSKKDRERSLEN